MELVTALVLATGAAAAETAAVGTAVTATAASTVGLGASTLSVLQGVATAGSVLSSIAGGAAGLAQSQMQGRQADLQSQEQAIRIKNEYLKKVGAARVAFSGSGIDISAGGQEMGIEAYLKDQATFETSISKNNATLAGETASMRGTSALISAGSDLFKTAGSFGIDIARRGV